MSSLTRGGLVPAKIYEVDESGNPRGSLSLSFMFNPKEYSVSLSNNFQETETGDAGHKVELTSAGNQTLTLKQLVFDTYDTGVDVSLQTRLIWDLMKPVPAEGSDTKPTARYVAFEWGTFRFVSVITQATQTFTLFKDNGMPVRANVDITFTKFGENPLASQNPSSGGGPLDRIWRVEAGDRLDLIAYRVYKDPAKWRLIAEYNDLENPYWLRPGTELSIPPTE